MDRLIGITGASGHLGFVVAKLLKEQGFQVRALCRSAHRGLEILGVEVIEGSVLDKAVVAEFVRGCDAVVHSAAIISIDGDPTGIVHLTNTEGPRTVLEAAAAAGVKSFVHVSSSHAVQANPLDQPFDETRPYQPKGSPAYDYSKATGEGIALEIFRSGAIKGCIVRPSSIVGPNDVRGSKLGTAILQLSNGTYPALTKGGYNFVDVRDVAQGIINAIDRGRNGEIYLLTGSYHSIVGFAEIVGKVTGRKVPKLVMPYWVLEIAIPFFRIAGRIKGREPLFTREMLVALKHGHPNMINAKAKRELGFETRSLEDSIRDFCAWKSHEAEQTHKAVTANAR